MTRRLELHHRYPAPPERIRDVLTDPEYLRDKARTVGGPGAELVSRTENGSGAVTVVQRQAVPDDAIPSMARSLVSGELMIERTEVWNTPTGGTIDVAISGAPGAVTGTIAVTPEGEGAVVTVAIEASIPVPLIGGKIERTIVDNIDRLGEVEYAFTRDWLRTHSR